MNRSLNRRQVLAGAGAAATWGLTQHGISQAGQSDPAQQQQGRPASGERRPFRYCLNTSTIRGQNLSLAEEIELAAKAGYQGIEPWMGEIQKHVEGGGSLSDLKKRIDDLGLAVPSAIGFANWIADDEQKRKQGLETAKRDMELLRAIGGTAIAAPPVGATKQTDLDLRKAAQRYAALLEVGRQVGVAAQLELWGFSATLSRLGELMFVAVESGHADACVLPDVYHIYKGGSDFQGLRLINAATMRAFHMNDYPAQPPRETIGDAHRVYPGDGVAPLADILRSLRDSGFQGMLSLELFNRDYWRQDPLLVARTGLEKMQAAVRQAVPSE